MFENLDKSKLTDGEKGFLQEVENGVENLGFAKSEDVKAINEELVNIKAKAEQYSKPQAESVEAQIRKQLGEYIHQDANGERIALKEAIKKNGGVNLTIKAASTITSTNVTAPHLSAEVTPIAVAPRAYSPIRDIANVGTTGARSIVIPEYKSKDGGAEWTPEGGLKPLLDSELSERTVNSGKVAVRAKFSIETLQDYPEFVSEVQNEMISSLGLVESDGILNGDGNGGKIVGVSGDMPAYSLEGIVVDKPNYLDAINAAYAQITANTYQQYQPNGLLLNVVDVANMMNTKDENGQPVYNLYKETFAALGIRVISTSSSVVPVGTFILGDFSKLVIRDRDDLQITVGWENDDFSKNLVTVIAERRLLAYILNQHKYAFVKDTFANVLAAIAQE